MTSFVGEVKLLAPYHKILQHVKDPLRYDRYRQTKFSSHFSPSPHFVTRFLCCSQSRDSGMIRTQMGSTVDKKIVADWT
jgi:hypothetical protein